METATERGVAEGAWGISERGLGRRYRGVCRRGGGSVPIGTAGCTQWCDLSRGNSSRGLSQAPGDMYLHRVRVGPLSLCSQVLLLPLGDPPTPALVLLHMPITLESGGRSPPPMWERYHSVPDHQMLPIGTHRGGAAFPGVVALGLLGGGGGGGGAWVLKCRMI